MTDSPEIYPYLLKITSQHLLPILTDPPSQAVVPLSLADLITRVTSASMAKSPLPRVALSVPAPLHASPMLVCHRAAPKSTALYQYPLGY